MANDLLAAIEAALRNPPAPMRREPVREPRRLCVCDHPEEGHADSRHSELSGCLNCRCKYFENSGRTEDPALIPHRLVPELTTRRTSDDDAGPGHDCP